MTLGEKILNLRKKEGISQEELAEIINISTTHMSHIETGKTKLSLQVFVDIAVALDISTDYLLQGQLEDETSFSSKQISNIIEKCSQQEIKMIEDVVKALKDSFDKYF